MFSAGNITRRKSQTNVANKNLRKARTSISTKYTIRNNIRFVQLQNTQDEVLNKEAKNYKEKETLQHRHQTPV